MATPSQPNFQPSFARLWRQVSFVPMLKSKWLTKTVKATLSAKITEAERGHRGEVFLIIENQLPIPEAYHLTCRDRALHLFSDYRVWDTEENTGVLVYVNICEKSLDIIADRGISDQVSPTIWRAMCDKAVAGMSNQKFEDSLCELLDEIGQLLRQYYYLENDPSGNELSDSVVFLT